MLTHLYIKNFTLIDELDIPISPGFAVITGETGAGKSILLGALAMLLGARAESRVIKDGRDRCVVEAHFSLAGLSLQAFFQDEGIDYDPDDCIVRRELNAKGKSRAYINDQPVALATLKQLGERLVDIHSQHQNLLIQKEDFQLQVLDTMAGDDDLLAQYAEAYATWHECRAALAALQARIQKEREEEDFMRFKYDELQDAHLQAGEQEQLEQEAQTLSHAEEIKEALYDADQRLGQDGGVVETVRHIADSLDTISRVFPQAADTGQAVRTAGVELKELARDISAMLDGVDFDPRRLDQLNQRLDQLYTLQRKWHADSVEELMAQRDDIATKLQQIQNADDEVAALQAQATEAEATCQCLAEGLGRVRKETAKEVADELRQRLIPLGMPNVRFEIHTAPKPLAADGADKVSYLFSANSGAALQPISDIASGGELSRVMLVLKAMASRRAGLPTLIFDEIDTGVSGKIAEQMARLMAQMAQAHRQIICITHLPQVAACGGSHYKVEKTDTPQGTTSRLRQLTDEERVHEIAQMLSGANITEAAITNAKELLGVVTGGCNL